MAKDVIMREIPQKLGRGARYLLTAQRAPVLGDKW